MLPVNFFPCTQDPPNGDNIGRVIQEIFEQAELCEQVGFDGFFFTEHHQQEDGYLPNPVLMAGLVGARTKTLKVGTCVLLQPLYHPIRLAEDIAVIDQATGGRVVIGAGIGYQGPDFDAVGISAKGRAPRTEEGVEIMRKAWTGEPFSYPSRYHTIENVRVTPRPSQPGGPPIWLAAWSPPGIARAARMADGWIADPIQSVSVIKAEADEYRALAKKAGRKPYICLMRDCIIGDSPEDAEKKSEPTMFTHRYYFEGGGYVMDEHLKDVKSAADLTFAVAAKDRLIAGTAEQCLDQLKMWEEVIQPDSLMLRLQQPGGPAHEQVLADIRTFGDKVIPHL